MKGSIHTEVLDQIRQLPPGKILFPSDFLHLGSIASVNMALSRIAGEQIIRRVAQGIYVYPKNSDALGTILPSLEEIANAVAEKEHVRIRPTGVTALNKLGLSTQVPMRVQYLTDGNPRSIKVGRRTLVFKKTTPKRLSVDGPTTFLIIQALETLGKTAATDEKLLRDLTRRLKKEELGTLRQDARLAPAWIGQILYKMANQIEQQHGDMATAN